MIQACSHALAYSAITANGDLRPAPSNSDAEQQALAFFGQEEDQGWPHAWIRVLADTAGWPGA